LGQQQEALAAIDEAVSIRRELADARPAVFGERLAASLEAKADILIAINRDAEAGAVHDEALRIRKW
jgi:hypothetical protein